MGGWMGCNDSQQTLLFEGICAAHKNSSRDGKVQHTQTLAFVACLSLHLLNSLDVDSK